MSALKNILIQKIEEDKVKREKIETQKSLIRGQFITDLEHQLNNPNSLLIDIIKKHIAENIYTITIEHDFITVLKKNQINCLIGYEPDISNYFKYKYEYSLNIEINNSLIKMTIYY